MVTEGQLFNICVAITSPPPQLFLWPLNSSFLIQLTIVPLTAGVRDIGKDNASLAIVGPFNDARRFYCLQLTAVADRVLQGTRSLNLTASLYGVAQPLLTISPNTTTVTIIDSTQIVIGFTQTQYTVTRKDSYVTFNVSILGGATIQGASVGVMFSTGDGTALAGADYDARTQLLVFNNTVTQLPIVVTIKDDEGLNSLITLNPHQTNVTIKDDHVLVIGFDPVVYSANVNGDSVAITVKVLQGSLAVPVSIRVFTENGTATSGSDYVATSQSVVFDSSSTNHTVTIQLINKLVSDASKVFSVGLSVETPEAKGRVTLSPSVANVTIVNTNVAVIGFVAGVYSVRKSEGSVSMMVGLLQGQLGAPVTVTFSTYSGTATAGLDFTQTTLPLVFNNTVTQLPIIVTIKDDGLFKYTDVYFGASLTLQSARGFEHLITLNPHQTNVTIKDDHVLVIGFDPVVYSANVNGDSVAITVKVLQGSLAVPVSIRVFTEDGTATSGSDYVATSQSVVFDSSSTNHTVTIQLINKLVSDASKVFSVGLSVETPEAKGRVTLSPSVANVTIVNTNVAVIGFVAGVYSVRKSEGSVSMMVGLLQGQLGAPVTVTFSTYSGTATAGELPGFDPSGYCALQRRQGERCDHQDDGVFKYTDVYFGASLTLQSARGFEHLITLNPHQTNVTIKDDHGNAWSVRKRSSHYSEGVTGKSCSTCEYRVFTEDGTATSGSDYVATSQSVVFDSSSTNHTVTIQLINKLVSDASKMFSVGLSVETPEAKGRVTLSPSVANVTIVNTNGVYSVRKSEGSVSMMVGLLQGQLGAPVTVTFSTYSGTATAGQDFTQTTLPLVFNNTVTQLPIIVTIKDDGVFKYTDVYFGASLTLQSARGFEHLITLNPHQTNVTIKDDHGNAWSVRNGSANVNGDSVAITVKVLQGSLALPVSIRVFTENGTATSGSDYVATSQSVVFDSSSTNHTVTIQLINKLVSDASKMFSVGLSVETPEAKGRVTLSPSVANVTVQGVLQNIEVNDSMIADPLFTVPLNVHSELFPALSLCYEIHGQPRQYYNLVSDTCTSVNARYNASLNGVGVNIIDDITVRAVDRAGQCVDIEVDVDCGVSVGGSRVQIYSLNEVYVRTYGNSSVRISVPNCNHQQLVMWILCQVRPIEDPITGKKFSAKMQKFVVTRGLSLGENSHGIIGRFVTYYHSLVASFLFPLQHSSGEYRLR
eukprot:Em0010g135a